MRRARKINYKKGLRKTSLMIIFTLIITFGVNFMSSSANTGNNTEFIKITVKTGDSLWLLAEKHDNNKIDLRKFVYQIKKVNNIGDTIYPGQEILIPIYK